MHVSGGLNSVAAFQGKGFAFLSKVVAGEDSVKLVCRSASDSAEAFSVEESCTLKYSGDMQNPLSVYHSAWEQDANRILQCCIYITSEDKVIHLFNVNARLSKENEIESVTVTSQSSSDPLPKRVVDLYSHMHKVEEDTVAVDVHGSMYRVLHSFDYTEKPSHVALPRICSHTCQVTSVHLIILTGKLGCFLGCEDDSTGASQELCNHNLLIVGDKDGYLRVSTSQDTSLILSLCTGNETGIRSIASSVTKKEDNKQDILLYAIDEDNILSIHDGYSGEVHSIIKLRAHFSESCIGLSDIQLFTLRDDTGDLGTFLIICVESYIRLFKIHAEGGRIEEISSIKIGIMKLTPLFNNGKVQLLDNKAPILVGRDGESELMIVLEQKQGKEPSLSTRVIC